MAYCVKFIDGDLKGRAFDLKGGIVIGRESGCEITVPDRTKRVSRRHAALTVRDGEVELSDMNSTHGTAVRNADGQETMLHGEKCALEPGCIVRLAGTQAFELLRGDAKSALGSSGNTGRGDLPTEELEQSVPGATLGAPSITYATKNTDTDVILNIDNGRTKQIKTIRLTHEEIAILIEEHKRRIRNKRRKRLVAVTVVFAIMMGLYYGLQPTPEKRLSWPLRVDGSFDVKTVELNTPFGDKALFGENALGKALTLLVPGGAGFHRKETTNSTGQVEVQVMSRLGAQRDVPLWVTFSCERNPRFVRNTRDGLYSEKVRALSAQGSWIFQSPKPLAFQGGDNGLPYLEGQYLRTVGAGSESEQRYGCLIFAVCGDCALTFTREIPASEQWRGGSILSAEPMFGVSDKFVERCWVGGPDCRDEPAEAMLSEAEGLLANKTPMHWPEIEFLIRSALTQIFSPKSGDRVQLGEQDEKLLGRALGLLSELRDKERTEFNRLHGEWKQYKGMKDDVGCQSVLKDGEKKFASPDDRRRAFFRRGGWTK